MPPGAFVDVVMSPRILRNGVLLEIRPMPVLRVARLLEQIQKAILALRVSAHVDIEGVQCGCERGKLRLRRDDASALARAGKLGQHDGREDAEQE